MLVAITCACCLASCKNESQQQDEIMLSVNTPLSHDPTDEIVLAQWWSNGKQLLRLQGNHYYLLYDNNSRYGKPRERGRWDQDGYAVLWLDPYNTLQADSTRVSITKIDGELAIVIPKLHPMFALKGPPDAREDQLIGSWQGPMGTLQLNANMTYSLSPAAGAMVDGRPVIGHGGRWRLGGGEVALAPTTPAVQPFVLRVRESGASDPETSAASQPEAPEVVLDGLGGELVKVRPPSV
jgi:hypothetical protein